VNGLLQLGIVLTAIDKMSGVIGGATDKAAQGFARLQQSVSQVSAKMTEMGTKASLMGHGIVSALQTPIAAFANLDEASTNLRVAMMDNLGRIPPQFAEINRQAVELGNILPGTTADFVNSARALIENGTSLETVVNGGLKAAAYLGVILKIPQAGAAEMVAKFREAFGLAENELTKMADLTQRAKFAFGLNPEEVKYAAQYAGATLNNLKLTGIENTKMFLAMQGIARQKGMEGSVFGTNFASMLNNIGMMEQKLGRNSKIMQEINSDLAHAGIKMNFFDSSGKFVGLEKMVAELEKLKVLTEQDKLNVMNKIFGMEGGRVASMLSDAGVGGLHNAMATMARQADLMQRIEETNKSARNIWEALTGTIENFWAAFGGPMVTSLYPYMKAVNEFVGGPMMAWIDRNKDLVKWLGLGALAVGGLLVVLGGVGIVAGAVGSGVSALLGVFSAVAGGVGMLGRALVWLGPILGRTLLTAFLAAAKGAWAFTTALLANPITWIIAAVIALGVGIYMLVRHWDTVKAATQRFWDYLKTVAGSIGTALSSAITGGMAAIQSGVSRAVSAVVQVGGRLLSVFTSLPARMFQAGVGIIEQLWQGMMSAAGKLLDGVKGIAEKVRSYWPFSPAKAGPLRDLHRVRLIETIAEGVDAGPLVKAMTAAAGAGMAPVNKATVAAKATSLMGDAKWQDPRLQAILGRHGGMAAKASSLMGDAKWQDPRLQAILRRHGGMADSIPPAARAMPRNLGRTVPVGGAPAAPAPRPAAGTAASGRGSRGQAGGGNVTVNYTVNAKGGADKDGIMVALKQHEHELVRLIEQVVARNARRAY
jgi:hypothetical protein